MNVYQHPRVRPIRIWTTALLTLFAALVARAQTNYWVGPADGDWHDGGAWMLGLPAAGQHVAVTQDEASLILTNETVPLASFTMTGGTLTFSNWTARLRAEAVHVADAVLTLPPAFKDTEMSNRVWIVCSDFLLGSGGGIDTDGKGYFAGQGPGAGATSERRAGGGYGGRGGRGLFHRRTGLPEDGQAYGAVAGPLFPGSGGDARGHAGKAGNGHGGGLVQIEAEGRVTILGTISANGRPPAVMNAGGGSGGGVFIACNELIGGATGSIAARGGNETALTGGAGAGGRVALMVTNATFLSGFSIDAGGGTGGAAGQFPAHFLYDAEPGTVYLSDASALPSLGEPSVVLTPETFPINHAILHVPGLDSLTASRLTVTNRMVGFGPADFAVVLDDSLMLSEGGLWVDRLSVGGSLTLSGATLRAPFVETDGALCLTGASIFHGANSVAATDLALADGSRLELRASATNGLSTQWGGNLIVSETLTVESGASLHLFCHPTDGGAPRVRAGTLMLAADGTIDADGKGFQKAGGPGKGIDKERYAGGGYGGMGGWGVNSTGADGLQYGSPTAPLYPGSGGGGLGHAREPAECHGGGLVHFEIKRTAHIQGTITANGWSTRVSPFIALRNAGDGSGGGIFIAADRITGDAAARLSACGGAGSPDGGAGAGGRIALWTRVGERQAPFSLDAGDRVYDHRLPTGFDALPAEVIDVSGSTDGCNPGGDGTVVWVEGPPQGTLFLLR